MARPNPWVLVPAAEYEAHMGPAGLDELGPLATLFGKIYEARCPRRVAVLGVGTGNGLEHVDVRLTGRTVGVDVNLSYLAIARQRLMRLGPSLQLLCGDLEKVELALEGFDLVHAALVLEFVDVRVAVPRIASWLAPGGASTVVLQLPGGGPALERSAHPRVRALAAAERLVPPEELRALCAAEGLVERKAFVVPLATGRHFFTALYEKPARGPDPRVRGQSNGARPRSQVDARRDHPTAALARPAR
jgi:SAM-dependent methyltransferase